MDPTTWAWIGVVVAVGAIATAVAYAGLPSRTLISVAVALAAGAMVAVAGTVFIDAWSVRATLAAISGSLAALGSEMLGSRDPLEAREVAVVSGRITAAAAGVGLLITAVVRILFDDEVDLAIVTAALGAGVSAAALTMRVALTDEVRPGLPELTALATLAAGSGTLLTIGPAAIWPLAMIALGVGAAALATFVPVAADAVRTVIVRGWFTAVVVGSGGVIVASVAPPAGVRHAIGLGTAIAIGAGTVVIVGELIRLYTTDRWRPAKRVASRARSGPAAVITSGFGDAARATGWLLLGMAVAAVAADRSGRLSDQPDLALALAGAGAVAALAALAAGEVMAVLAERVPIPGDRASVMALDASAQLVAAGSMLGPVGRATTAVGASAMALVLLLVGVRRLEPGEIGAWAGLGALLGTAAVWYAAGWLLADSDAASSRRGMYAAAVAIATPVAAVIVSPAAGLGLLAGVVGCGGGLAFWGVAASGSWENVRRLIEAGAYGGVGSRAHRAVVAADVIGARWRTIAVPGLLSTLVAAAALMALFAGSTG